MPVDHPTIQTAIDAANNGDTVLVAPGTYVENMDFLGKAITVTSEAGPQVTIIDGNQAASVVSFTSGEGPASILEGMTIRNGRSRSDAMRRGEGGGIWILESSPTIANNIITDNLVSGALSAGGGIGIASGSPIVDGNVIRRNSQSGSSEGGGAIHVRGSSSVGLSGNTIYENSAVRMGGISIDIDTGTPTVTGNIIRGNNGGGIGIDNHADVSIVQNVIVDNYGPGIIWSVHLGGPGPIVLNNTIANNKEWYQIHSDGTDIHAELINNLIIDEGSQYPAVFCNFAQLRFNTIFDAEGTPYTTGCSGGTEADGNIFADPLFIDSSNGDYHLDGDSPAVDAGDNTPADVPATDFDGIGRILDGDEDGSAVVDMGAYEFDPDSSGTLRFSVPSYLVAETAGNAVITVVRKGGAAGEVAVDFATSNRTATAGSDYVRTSGTIRFADGDKGDKTFTIPIINDALPEGNETVNLALSNLQGGASLGSLDKATLTIGDGALNNFPVFDSQPGDSIGQEMQLSLTPADGAITATHDSQGSFQITFVGADRWDAAFAAAGGAPLVTGAYEGAARFPFQGSGEPGLTVSGVGRGCNSLTGRFDLLEAIYGPGDKVERFAANFEQHCEGRVPALFGTVLYNASASWMSADLSISITDNRDPILPGADYSFLLTVENAGPIVASNVQIDNILPAGVSFVSASGDGWSCSEASGTLTCARGSLAIGAPSTVTVTVTAPGVAGTLSNTATVSSAWTDSNAADNSDTEKTAVEFLRASELFPLQSGNEWTYLVNGRATVTQTVLAGTVLVNGVATKALRDIDGDTSYYTNDSSGLLLHRVFSPGVDFGDGDFRNLTVTFSPPLPLATPQTNVGDSIIGSGGVTYAISGLGSFTLNYSSTSAIEVEENVSVPLDDFLTVRNKVTLSLTGSILGQGVNETGIDRYWLAKHIGPVKVTEEISGQALLDSFELTAVFIDSDGDGVNVTEDNCPTVANPLATDTDGDGYGDACDDDDDGDGVPDQSDDLPLDPLESIDTDKDGIGNNADTDDDGDGLPDTFEVANGLDSLDATDASFDADSDGLTNLQEFELGTDVNAADSDGDGINDGDEIADHRNPLVNEGAVIQIINSILMQ